MKTTALAVEHPPIRCLLEMQYDGFLSVTRQPGCSQDDVLDILRLLTQSDGPFDHITIMPPALLGVVTESEPEEPDEPHAARNEAVDAGSRTEGQDGA